MIQKLLLGIVNERRITLNLKWLSSAVATEVRLYIIVFSYFGFEIR